MVVVCGGGLWSVGSELWFVVLDAEWCRVVRGQLGRFMKWRRLAGEQAEDSPHLA